MSSKLAVLIATAVLLLIVVLVWTNRQPSTHIGDWQVAGNVGADSLVRALTSRVGAAPDTISSCGPHRMRVAYVNAPIDIPVQVRFGNVGRDSIYSSITNVDFAERYAHPHIAEAIALLAWFSGARADSIDTVSVALWRMNSDIWQTRKVGLGDEFNFVRDPKVGSELVPIGPTRYPCPMLD